MSSPECRDAAVLRRVRLLLVLDNFERHTNPSSRGCRQARRSRPKGSWRLPDSGEDSEGRSKATATAAVEVERAKSAFVGCLFMLVAYINCMFLFGQIQFTVLILQPKTESSATRCDFLPPAKRCHAAALSSETMWTDLRIHSGQ